MPGCSRLFLDVLVGEERTSLVETNRLVAFFFVVPFFLAPTSCSPAAVV